MSDKEMKEMMGTGMKVAKSLGLEKYLKQFMQKFCKSQVLKNGRGSFSPGATPSLGAGKSQSKSR